MQVSHAVDAPKRPLHYIIWAINAVCGDAAVHPSQQSDDVIQRMIAAS